MKKQFIVNAIIGTTLGLAPLSLQADSFDFGESSVNLLIPFAIEPVKHLHFGEILMKPGQHTEARVNHNHQGTHHFGVDHEKVPTAVSGHFHVNGAVNSRVDVTVKSEFTLRGKRTGATLNGKIRHIKVMTNREEIVVNGGLLPAFQTIPAYIRDAKGHPIMIGGTLAIPAGTPDDDYIGSYQFYVFNK
jgi:hypothetical protein